MFRRSDPNRDLALQQNIFGTRNAPPPTLGDRLRAIFTGHKAKKAPAPVESTEPLGDVIRNALFSDLPDVAPDFPILSNPKKGDKLPEQFVVLSLVEDDLNAVQIELFMDDVIEARHKLLEITSRFERGQTPQVEMEGLCLKSDRMVIHRPSLPGRACATCRVIPGKKNIFA
jgi:hypothetical protein